MRERHVFSCSVCDFSGIERCRRSGALGDAIRLDWIGWQMSIFLEWVRLRS